MFKLFNQSFSTADLIPHSYSLQWNPLLLWTSATSDAAIAIAYFSISITLWNFSKKRPDILHSGIFWLFGLFIIASSITYFLDVASIWKPSYRLMALAEGITAIFAVVTAIILWRTMPLALKASLVKKLEDTRGELQKAHGLLHLKVKEHAQELETANITLKTALLDANRFREADDMCNSLTFYDTLTGLPNRQLLLDRLQQVLTSSTLKNYYGALLNINLDDLKSLNNTKGFDIGNLLLKQVAKRIQETVPQDSIVARLRSDSFVVVLYPLGKNAETAAKQANDLGQRIRDQAYDLEGLEYYTTACIGITLFFDHQTTAEGLLKNAASAMFVAKQAGHDQIHFFDSSIQTKLEARLRLELMLRKAIPDQFQLYYQAQTDRDGRIFAAEALIRWLHPEEGIIAPDVFIPLAEETGLIFPIGRWVLETACRQLKVWESKPATRHLQLAVNVSAKEFHQINFVEQVLEVLSQTGASPMNLELELTEGTLIDKPEIIYQKIICLKEKGVKFSLDDFGTGFSSLSYLKNLPINGLKIDQSFVRALLTDPKSASIVRTIIALADNLALSVIAEGVETEEQRNFLSVNGCDNFQGYLFSRPIPLADFEKLLMNQSNEETVEA